MNNVLYERLAAGALVVLAVVMWNPLDLWMPNMIHMMVIAGVFVVSALFVGLVLRSAPRDEREAHLREVAGRTGYLTGMITVAACIVYQDATGSVDMLLVVILLVLVLSNIITHWYNDTY